ncbi:MAG TPA: hypothetical protein VMV41_12380, partial [Cellulomonadaceae bacterium]|nr:hypothetical protein [Cellulomonadaceae bacterium]
MTVDPGTYLRALARHVRVQELLEYRWAQGWSVRYPARLQGLPPDTTLGRWPNMCTARVRSDWSCTRIAAHTGRH